MNRIVLWSGLILLMVSTTLWGQQRQPEVIEEVVDGGPVLGFQTDGEDTLEWLLGLGGRVDNGLGYFYVSRLETESRGSVSKGKIDGDIPRENEYTSTRIGLYAEGYDRNSGEGGGFAIFLYKNESDFVIDRYGLGATVDLAHVWSDVFRLYAGVDLMPGFISTDWEEDALLEYTWRAGATLTLFNLVDVGVAWRAGRTWDPSLRTRQYEHVSGGLRLVF